MTTLDEIAREYQAYEAIDSSEFRRKVRVLQSMWRESKGYGVGTHRTPRHGSRPLGSRLEEPRASAELLNYLTPTIRQVVRDEVLDEKKSRGKMYARPRIFDDLLSSQPLSFNLFGELKRNLDLAKFVFRDLLGSRVSEVTGIEFEYSPGRGNSRYTGDRTAFDVYVAFQGATGGRAFVGIEVKYHEDLRGRTAPHRERYSDIAKQMDCFKEEYLDQLRKNPLQQLWRDHLLAGALRKADGFRDGLFAVLYPKDNLACAGAVSRYRECLSDTATFQDWTLEEFTKSVKNHATADWIDAFVDRYLDCSKLGNV